MRGTRSTLSGAGGPRPRSATPKDAPKLTPEQLAEFEPASIRFTKRRREKVDSAGRDRGMKFILIPISEAITIIVVPVYWVIKLAITLIPMACWCSLSLPF